MWLSVLPGRPGATARKRGYVFPWWCCLVPPPSNLEPAPLCAALRGPRKVVHGDLKPANFVFVKGSLKLIDFGIAKAISNDTTNISRDARVSMPSEQQQERHRPVRPRKTANTPARNISWNRRCTFFLGSCARDAKGWESSALFPVPL